MVIMANAPSNARKRSDQLPSLRLRWNSAVRSLAKAPASERLAGERADRIALVTDVVVASLLIMVGWAGWCFQFVFSDQHSYQQSARRGRSGVGTDFDDFDFIRFRFLKSGGWRADELSSVQCSRSSRGSPRVIVDVQSSAHFPAHDDHDGLDGFQEADAGPRGRLGRRYLLGGNQRQRISGREAVPFRACPLQRCGLLP